MEKESCVRQGIPSPLIAKHNNTLGSSSAADQDWDRVLQKHLILLHHCLQTKPNAIPLEDAAITADLRMLSPHLAIERALMQTQWTCDASMAYCCRS